MDTDRPANPLISIVAAFYDEEAAIEAFFAEVERHIAGLEAAFEFVCVNDGSRDATLALLRDRLAADPRIRVVNLSRNFGKEAAITAGLAYAKGDAAIVIDADLQDPPSLIPKLLEEWEAGFDVVYGVRASRRTDTALKRLTAKGFYAAFNAVTDVKIPPGAGDYRLLDRRAIDTVLSLRERNRFMKGLFAWIGFKQSAVPFDREARIAGATHWSYWRLFNFAIDGLTSFSIAPLRIASVVGILISLLGFAYAGYLVARTLLWGVDVPGYASLMVVMMCLGGVQLVCLGLVGEYLGRLYIEAKGRPLYVVADVFGAGKPALSRARATQPRETVDAA
ncbi:MAG: glycosyltransferase family 2 protein [Rhizomicrobium sp.]